MRIWATQIEAIDPETRKLATYVGPDVPGISLADAKQYCRLNKLGYCEVIGEILGWYDDRGNFYHNPELN